MKNRRYTINLYVIIPLIFGGLSALSVLATYRILHYYNDRGLAPEWPLAFWGIILVLFTFLCGLLTVKFIIDPVKKFVDKTQTLGVLRSMEEPGGNEPAALDIHDFSRVFDKVSEILTKVEARELFPDIIGQSKQMRGIFNQILKVAPTDATVLIFGETGTGKELIADSIHRHSQRQSKPFVAINCAAIPEGLLESELFGHEKGAFTGATRRKPGKFETANNGTLFLDEIGDMPLETQAKVLRGLEDKKIQRLGGFHPLDIDVRFIAATNKALPDMVEKGLFRQDLLYRLNAFTLHLPPLRERREDIPLLADHFLFDVAPEKRFSSGTIQILMSYDWPGNIRELKNAVKSAALLAESDIDPIHLPSSVTRQWHPLQETYSSSNTSNMLSQTEKTDAKKEQTLDLRLQEVEKLLITQALEQTRGIQKQAARLLGIKERSLWHRLKKYRIDASAYKIK